MQFSNPIVGGAGSLVRQSIHSPDYVAGVSGWTINKDGTAEFNSTAIRGDLKVTGDDGSVVWIREIPSTDPFYFDRAVVELYPPGLPADSYPAVLSAEASDPTLPSVTISGPGLDVGGVLRAPSFNLLTDTNSDYRYINGSAEDIALGVPSTVDPYYPTSRFNLITETALIETEQIYTAGEIRNATAVSSGVSWVGMKNGQWYEENASGTAVTSGVFTKIVAVTTGSAAFVADPGFPTEGITFTAPASGVVEISWGGELINSAAASGTVLGYELRTGGTIGSGTVVVGPSDDRTVRMAGTARFQMANYDTVTGLTPGSTYNIRLMYRATGGTGTFERRRLRIQPRLY